MILLCNVITKLDNEICENVNKCDTEQEKYLYKNYANQFEEYIKELEGVNVINSRDNGNSYYVTVKFDGYDNNNKFKKQTYRFSNHAKDLSNVITNRKNIISMSPKESDYETLINVFNEFYQRSIDNTLNSNDKIYLIVIRKMPNVYIKNGRRKFDKDDKRYFVSVTTSDGHYLGKSKKGATSAIHNIENLNPKIKDEIIKDIGEKAKLLSENKTEGGINAIVKIPVKKDNIEPDKLLSSIINIFNKILIKRKDFSIYGK